MSGLDKNRIRNKTVSFRVSAEEARQLEARIKVCGMIKQEYFLQSLLNQEINIVGGKYQSDRLSLELRRLSERIKDLNDNNNEQLRDLLNDCRILLAELQGVMQKES